MGVSWLVAFKNVLFLVAEKSEMLLMN